MSALVAASGSKERESRQNNVATAGMGSMGGGVGVGTEALDDMLGFFGRTGTQPQQGADRNLKRQFIQLAQSSQFREYLETLLLGLALDDVDWITSAEGLPARYTETLVHTRRKLLFHQDLAPEVPATGVPRLIERGETQYSVSSNRYGLAGRMEIDEMHTPAGQEEFRMSLMQLSNSMKLNMRHDGMCALINPDPEGNSYMAKYGVQNVASFVAALLRERDEFGLGQKSMTGTVSAHDQAAKNMLLKTNVEPTMFVIDRALQRYLHFENPKMVDYDLAGPAGPARFNKTGYVTKFRGTTVVNPPVYEPDPEENGGYALTEAVRRVGEVYLFRDMYMAVPAKEYSSSHLDVQWYDEQKDGWSKHTMRNVVLHCDRFFGKDENGEDGEPRWNIIDACKGDYMQVTNPLDPDEFTRAETLGHLTLRNHALPDVALTRTKFKHMMATALARKLTAATWKDRICDNKKHTVIHAPESPELLYAGDYEAEEKALAVAILSTKIHRNVLINILDADVSFPFEAAVWRLWQGYIMHSPILFKGGAATGESTYGHVNVMMSTDGANKTHYVNATWWCAAVIHDERRIAHLNNHFYKDCLGGAGSKYFTRKDLAALRDENDWIVKDFHTPSCVAQLWRHGSADMQDEYMDIRGKLDNDYEDSATYHYEAWEFESKNRAFFTMRSPFADKPDLWRGSFGDVNTIAFQGPMYACGPKAGEFTIRTTGTGHHGPWVYPGCKSIRRGVDGFVDGLKMPARL